MGVLIGIALIAVNLGTISGGFGWCLGTVITTISEDFLVILLMTSFKLGLLVDPNVFSRIDAKISIFDFNIINISMHYVGIRPPRP